MPPNTTPEQRAIICVLKKLGHTNDNIRANLPNRHDITNCAINYIFKKYADKENYDEVGHSAGCPRKLSERDCRVALRHLANQDCRNATELRRELFPQVSTQTVKRALRREGLLPFHQASVRSSPSRTCTSEKSGQSSIWIGQSKTGMPSHSLTSRFSTFLGRM